MGVDHLSKLPNKSAENKLGLSLLDISVLPISSFSPHANPILGTNGGMNTKGEWVGYTPSLYRPGRTIHRLLELCCFCQCPKEILMLPSGNATAGEILVALPEYARVHVRLLGNVHADRLVVFVRVAAYIGGKFSGSHARIVHRLFSLLCRRASGSSLNFMDLINDL